MRKLLLTLKEFFQAYKKWPENVKFFFIDIWGWLNSLLIFLFRNIKRPAIMYGYGAFYFAKKYADKRTRRWKAHWDQSGRLQAVSPFNDTQLFVYSKMELKELQKRKILNRKLRPKNAIRAAYYKTKL